MKNLPIKCIAKVRNFNFLKYNIIIINTFLYEIFNELKCYPFSIHCNLQKQLGFKNNFINNCNLYGSY